MQTLKILNSKTTEQNFLACLIKVCSNGGAIIGKIIAKKIGHR